MKNLRNIDRRIIYLIMLIALGFPIISPIGSPFDIAPNSREFYEIVDALQPGDVVVLSYDFSISSQDELNPSALAVTRHLLEQKKGVKIINLAFWATGPQVAVQNMDMFEKEGLLEGWVYGEDWCDLGYIAGGEVAMAAFADNIKDAFRRDARGTDTKSLPMMANINSAKDIDLVVEFGSGTPGTPEMIRQIVDRYGTKYIASLVSVSIAGSIPYYNSGQLNGYLNGLRGAGEYEALYGHPGAGTAAMDSYTFGHLTIILFVIIGNIAYYADPDRRKK